MFPAILCLLALPLVTYATNPVCPTPPPVNANLKMPVNLTVSEPFNDNQVTVSWLAPTGSTVVRGTVPLSAPCVCSLGF